MPRSKRLTDDSPALFPTEEQSLLPCIHLQTITDQLDATKNLLRNLHTLHPEVLRQHGIDPDAYLASMLFRSAVESIRGTYIASSTKNREAMVNGYLAMLKYQGKIIDYEYTAADDRCDFNILIEEGYMAGLEVKGGEGNSINISERPADAKEFIVWSHLDGAIVNQPSHGAHAVIGRLLNEMTNRKKHVDALFIRDTLCGTPIRPCPKYLEGEGMIAPDIFLFPQYLPVLGEPNPPVHNFDSLKLPALFLDLFNVKEEDRENHLWEVHVEMQQSERNQVKLKRESMIFHKGERVDKGKSRRR